MKLMILIALVVMPPSLVSAAQVQVPEEAFAAEAARAWAVTVAANEQNQDKAKKTDQADEEPDCE